MSFLTRNTCLLCHVYVSSSHGYIYISHNLPHYHGNRRLRYLRYTVSPSPVSLLRHSSAGVIWMWMASLSDRTTLSPDRVAELLEVCLKSTYFSHVGTFYEQHKCAVMGSPVSGVVANLYMEFFEELAVYTLLYIRFIYGAIVTEYIIVYSALKQCAIWLKHSSRTEQMEQPSATGCSGSCGGRGA